MYFKEIDVYGFKSFADRSKVVFEPGVTVIVGPNGCGKSNIVDAVRWAFGEQSARILRGKKIRDVIFAGSSERRRLGMAEVSVTLSDIDGELSSGYNEVTIARRVFRSGESEYLLNKSVCKLRDINELLFDTGIGVDSYFIMEQGKVDAILNAKPIDRRAVFEEAAGISKYKYKRDEAIRKLERSEDDLLRLSDIVGEVKKQMISLERQAEKAERYRDLQTESRELEIKLNLSRYGRLKTRWSSLLEKIDVLSGRMNEAESKVKGLVSDMDGMKSKSDQLEEEMEARKDNVYRIENEIKSASSSIELLHQRSQSMDEIRSRADSEISLLEDKIAELAKEDEGASRRLEDVGRKKEELKEILTGVEDELSVIQGRFSQAEERSETKKTEMVEILSRTAGLRNTIFALENDNRRIKKAIDDLTAQQDGLAAERSELERSLSQLELELGDRKGQIEHLKSELDRTGSERENTSRSLLKLEADYEDVKGRSQSKTSRLDLLKGFKREFEGYREGARVILQGLNGSRSGIHGALANFIKTNPEYETAIEIALGESIQSIITASVNDAAAAIQYLTVEKKGRATFIPVDIAKPFSTNGHFGRLLEREGVVGDAVSLVRFDPDFKDVVKSLLGRTILVKDLDTALRLVGEGEIDARIVTLEGEVVDSSGMISGGSIGEREVGLLGREREIDGLEEEIKTLRERFTQVEGELNTTKERAADLENESRILQDRVHREEIAGANQEKDLSQLKAEMNRIDHTISIIETERSEAEESIAELARQEADLKSQIEKLGQENVRLEAEVGELGQEMNDLGGQREDLSLQSVEAKVSLASLTQEWESMGAEVGRLNRLRSEVEEDIKRRQEEIRNSLAVKEEMGSELAALEEKLVILNDDKAKEEEFLLGGKENKGDVQKELGNKEEEVESQREGWDELRNDFHQLEVEKAQLKVQMDEILNRVEEDYDIGSEEIDARAEAEQINIGEVTKRIGVLRRSISDMGGVNLAAIDEYKELEERYNFLSAQQNDLVEASRSLDKTIGEIDRVMKARFLETLEAVRANFSQTFKRLFGGGKADLVLVESEEDLADQGVDIIAQPAGKGLQNISALSGGEKALTANALLFALFMYKPSPFCILDEVDAPLDDANVGRFEELVRELSAKSQFIIVSHNKKTMKMADSIYGVTMEEAGVSKLVSVKYD